MEHRGAVVVGLGGPRENNPELDWAAREAASRGRELHIVRAYDPSDMVVPWEQSIQPTVADALRSAADEQLRSAIVHARRLWPELLVWGEVVDGAAAEVLCEVSEQAELTVLGSRRLTALDAAILGSVSSVVATRGSGPVVVVGSEGFEAADDACVVVGVDGSPQMDGVFGFAFDFASRHGRPLHAVYCWRPDLLASMQWRPEPPAPERADRWLAEAVAGWQEKYPDVAVRRSVVHDYPIAGLVTQSERQELLVVGSHSKHGRVATLLGSVSQGVLHHADCPIAIVHPREVDDTDR